MRSRRFLFVCLAASVALGPATVFAQRRPRGRARPIPTASSSPAPTASTAPAASTAPTASPQDQEARTHFDRGLALFQSQDFDGALAEFQAAYDTSHRPTVLYNIGVAHQALHHYPEAARAIEQYLREATLPADRRAQVEQGLAEIRNFIAHITLAGLPDGAIVTIDGEPAGTAPFTSPIAVGTGRHIVIARMEGYRDAQESLLIAGGQERELRITMHSSAEAVSTTGGTVTVRGAPAGATIDLDGQSAQADVALPVAAGVHAVRVRATGFVPYEGQVTVSAGANRVATVHLSSGQRPSIVPFVAFAGLTVASGVAMAVMGVVTQSTSAEFQTLTMDDPRAAALSETGVMQRTVTNVLIGTTVAFGIGAAVTGFLYFRAAGRASSTLDIAYAPRLEGGGEAVVRVRF